MPVKKYQVTDYQRSWSKIFLEESKKIQKIFPRDIVAVHHIGSTAVPKLTGKPTIDMLFVVKDIQKINSHISALIKLGYQSLGAKNDPGTHLFEKYINGKRCFIAHFYPESHPEIKQMLAIRDYLRAHPDWVKKYSALKTDLAKKFSTDYKKYSAHKYKFMAQIKKQALDWSKNI